MKLGIWILHGVFGFVSASDQGGLNAYFDKVIAETTREVARVNRRINRDWKFRNTSLVAYDPTDLLLEVSKFIQRGDPETDRLDPHSHADRRGLYCGSWCMTAMLTDFLLISGVMIGYQCKPFALMTYFALGILTLTIESHESFADALCDLAQQYSSVGYGSFGNEAVPANNRGLQLFHAFHAWAGIMFVSSQLSEFVEMTRGWLEDLLAYRYRPDMKTSQVHWDILKEAPACMDSKTDIRRTFQKKSLLKVLPNDNDEVGGGLKAYLEKRDATMNEYELWKEMPPVAKDLNRIMSQFDLWKQVLKPSPTENGCEDPGVRQAQGPAEDQQIQGEAGEQQRENDEIASLIEEFGKKCAEISDRLYETVKKWASCSVEVRDGKDLCLDQLQHDNPNDEWLNFKGMKEDLLTFPSSFPSQIEPSLSDEFDVLKRLFDDFVAKIRQLQVFKGRKQTSRNAKNEVANFAAKFETGTTDLMGVAGALLYLKKHIEDKGNIVVANNEATRIVFEANRSRDRNNEDIRKFEYSTKEGANYLANSQTRRLASVGILLIEVLVWTLIYAEDSRENADGVAEPDRKYVKRISDTFYMIMMTFSTVGYGDIAPATQWGKALSPMMISHGTNAFENAAKRMLLPPVRLLDKYTQFSGVASDADKMDNGDMTFRMTEKAGGFDAWIGSCKDVSRMPERMRDFWKPTANKETIQQTLEEAIQSRMNQ